MHTRFCRLHHPIRKSVPPWRRTTSSTKSLRCLYYPVWRLVYLSSTTLMQLLNQISIVIWICVSIAILVMILRTIRCSSSSRTWPCLVYIASEMPVRTYLVSGRVKRGILCLLWFKSTWRFVVGDSNTKVKFIWIGTLTFFFFFLKYRS